MRLIGADKIKYDDIPIANARGIVVTRKAVMQKAIEDMPTIERQKGKWELYESKVDCYDVAGVKTWANKYRCCNCGFINTVIEDFGHYDFCPHCGAEMEAEEWKKM